MQSTLSICDLNYAIDIFIDTLHNLIFQYVLLATFTKSNFLPWTPRELKDLIRLKNKAHATFDPLDYQVFS